MSDRPFDWSPVGLGSDPIPGDPAVVRRGGLDYQETARQIGQAAASLSAIEAGGQVSLAVDAVMARKTETMDDISRAQGRYQTTGEALVEYADALAAAQETADAALALATTARRDKETAQASKLVYLNLAADEDDEDAARRYDRLVRDFQDDIDAADATIRQAKADIDQAETSRDAAAEKAASRIQQITGSDGLNDSWWDDWGAKLTELLDKISAIAGVLALVVAFIPVIGQALAAALLVVSAVTAIASAVLKTAAAAQGETSWLNAGLSIVFAVLACTGLGALRGGFAAAKAAGGLKALAGMGPKAILAGTGRNALAAGKGLGRSVVATIRNAPAKIRGLASGCRSAAPAVESEAEIIARGVTRTQDGVVHIQLKPKKGWNQSQLDAAAQKVTDVNARGPVVTAVTPGQRAVKARSLWERAYGKIAPGSGKDVDHILDLQLGGKNEIDNLQLLDKSVNRSLGAQINNAIKRAGLPDGTIVQLVF